MPELPEVETVRRGLTPVMEGHRIARAEVRRPDLRWPFPPDMAARLSGKRVLALRRRAKYLLADLDSGESLIWHLGMSGRVLIDEAEDRPADGFPPPASHDHVVFHMETGARVTFNDARRFGSMDLIATAALDTHPLLASLGPEPFANTFNGEHLRAAFQGRRSAVKAALLDQRIVSGLGNIYVCEALFRAGISPLRQAGRISGERIEALVPQIRAVLSEAIDAGGSSLQDHRQTNGELGYFQHMFQVYDREGEACQTVACSGTIKRTVQSGRSSFYCPACQR